MTITADRGQRLGRCVTVQAWVALREAEPGAARHSTAPESGCSSIANMKLSVVSPTTNGRKIHRAEDPRAGRFERSEQREPVADQEDRRRDDQRCTRT